MADDAITTTDICRPFVIPAEDIRWLMWNGGLLAFYWTVLAYCYVHSVSPANATNTFLYLSVDPIKEIEGIVWAFALLPTINTHWRRPSDFGLTLLYFTGLVPALIIFGLADQLRSSMYTMLAGYLAVYIGCRAPIRIPYVRLLRGGRSGVYFAALGVLIVAAWFFAHSDHSSYNIDLREVYDYRADAVSLFDVGPLKKLAPWVPKVLNPFLFCFFLFRKKWILFTLTFVFQIFCLVIFQQKSVFIPCLILPLLYFAPTGRRGQIWFILAFAASIIACEIAFEKFDIGLFIQFWTRRFFFDGQFLYFRYFDVFKKIGFVYYSDSFLSGFLNYPFPYPCQNMVNYYTFGTPNGNANTGFLGAGYMEFGNIGVVVTGLMAGLMLKLFDRIVSLGIPIWFFGTVAYMPFMSMLVSQNFTTAIIGSGGVFILAILMLCTRELGQLTPPARKVRFAVRKPAIS